MKKVLSLFLSIVMLLSINAGLEINAYANNIETAYELLANGGTCSGKVYYDNYTYTSDFYHINLPFSGILSLNISATASININLYRNDGKSVVLSRTLDYDSNFGRVQETINLDLRGGTYYLKIARFAYDSSYQISTSFTAVNESFYENDEYNNDYVDTASPISFGSLYYGAIGLSESDFYSFYVPSKTDIKVSIDFYTTMKTISVSLLDKSGKTISINGTDAKNGHISCDFIYESLEAGQYFLKISDYYQYSYGYGPYAFSISPFCNHNYKRVRKDATYFSKGYNEDVCIKCGYSYICNYIQKQKLSIPSCYLNAGVNQFVVNWYSVKDASGYEIQYSTSKKFAKNKTKTVTINSNKKYRPSKKIKKLKSNKKYYVRVRAYKKGKVNGKSTKVYSSWSKVKSVKTK